ncbi:MAG: permease, partial [Acidobacteria bacterium]|nr:permease [Acidobacteriota bacterium]NIO57998.1 permease [Acidobacteriota bacterium]NIQ29003.1 permease [Acidobacteriota bacterium]NIQ83525.1 permease [Acidobacteriota bacterium]
ITRTYNHLFGAILGFVAIEFLLFTSGLAEQIFRFVASTNWLLILGAFMVVSWIASRTAHRSMSMGAQYAALAAFVVAQALIFAPLLFVAEFYAEGGVISSAALVTVGLFAGLTAIAFWTRKDFSFLGAILRWGGLLALGAIAAGVIFGTGLGTWFSVGMVGFAGAAILYDTSRVIKHYPEDRYVAAALELFASVALMFWYILQL